MASQQLLSRCFSFFKVAISISAEPQGFKLDDFVDAGIKNRPVLLSRVKHWLGNRGPKLGFPSSKDWLSFGASSSGDEAPKTEILGCVLKCLSKYS